MENLPAWMAKVQSIWFAVGVFISVLATQGIPIPELDIIQSVFSEAVWNAGIAAIGSVLSFVQIVRAIFAKGADAAVKVLSVKDKRKYMFNPFKINI